MKRTAFALLGIATLFGATSAFAADVVRPYTPPPLVLQQPQPRQIVVQPKTTDVYVGILMAHTKGHIDYDQIDPAIKGWEGGFFAGFNHVVGPEGRLVIGAEADIAKSHEKGANHYTYYDNSWDRFDVTTKAGLDWTGSVRGRVGVLLGEQKRVLLYGTAGVGVAGGHANMTNIGSYGTATWLADQSSTKFTAFGPTVGVGVEVMVTPMVSVRLEYDHTQYGKPKLNHDYQMFDNTTSVKLKDDRVMAGLVFHF